MKNPSVAVGNDERIPIREIDLVHIKAIRMIFDFHGDVDPKAHGEGERSIRRERLWQMYG